MTPIAAFLATGALFLGAVLGLPLVSLTAGIAGGLLLAPHSLPWAIAALGAGAAIEGLAIRLAPVRDPVLAQMGALLVLGRVLGTLPGAGAWYGAFARGLDARPALRDLQARGLRAFGVLAVLTLFAVAS